MTRQASLGSSRQQRDKARGSGRTRAWQWRAWGGVVWWVSAGQARARDGVGEGGVSLAAAGVTSSAPTTPSLCQEPGITVAATEPGVAPGLQAPGCGSPVGRASASGVCLCPGRGHFADKKMVVEGIQATGLPGSWSRVSASDGYIPERPQCSCAQARTAGGGLAVAPVNASQEHC